MSDEFSDGEFSSGPAWSGTSSDFIINASFQLQLNSKVAGTSWLLTEFSTDALAEATWEFYTKQSFAASAANFGRFYLASDKADFTTSLNGYFLQFGEAGSNDAVELFRQSGDTRVSICRASGGSIASAFEIRVKVTRSRDGLWSLFIDYAGGHEFALQASGVDTTHSSARFAGILCTYTITNATRFYYDDITMFAVKAPDTSPPQISSVEATSPTSLMVSFSEELDLATAEAVSNYSVSPVPGHPNTSAVSDDGKTVQLTFRDSFINGTPSTLYVNGLADRSGNYVVQASKEFLHFHESPVFYRDIIITEILPDPSPPVGLPEAEFLEVYNRSSDPVDLSQWILADETSSAVLPGFILLPGSYLILCSAANAARFSPFGKVLSFAAFPALNNSGDAVILRHPDGRAIDSLRYTMAWYHDEKSSEGGWSLERIDPDNICEEETNWTVSEAPQGGTPGQQNSVLASRPDNTGPRVLSAELIDPYSLLIQFNEALERALPDQDKFSILPPMSVSSVAFPEGTHSAILLLFSEPVTPGIHFEIKISEVFDCPGNIIDEKFSTMSFILPEAAEPGDVAINEVLFNPQPTGVDFVEVYNASKKTIDLKNWTLRNFVSNAKNASTISPVTFLIEPGEYKVFTKNAAILKGEYVMGIESTFSIVDLPALNDDEGSVSLIDAQGQLIDTMHFDEQMHASIIQEREGISLERVSAIHPGIDKSNWRSASAASGFATPGYLNSNARPDSHSFEGAVMVDPEVIQPSRASNAFTQIKYRFETGGFIANVRITDPEGREVKQIAESTLLGVEGFFRWDGDMEDGSLARMGYYLIWFEIFDLTGRVNIFRRRIAVY